MTARDGEGEGTPRPTETSLEAEDLVAEYLELWLQGQPEAAEARLVARPELEAMARRRIDSLRSLGALPAVAETLIAERYRTVRVLGSGGMGIVYEALDTRTDRRVALKVLSEHLMDHGDARSRFEHEARRIAQLRHPNIVSVFDVGLDEKGRPYYTMELVTGLPLSRWIDAARREDSIEHPALRPVTDAGRARVASGELDDVALRWVLDVADALRHVHSMGMLHRDIKPSNVLLRLDGRAMLCDFGLARELDRDSETRTGVFLGTPDYAPPELWETGRRPDIRSEVHLLGSTLAEALTGHRPRRGRFEPRAFRGLSRDLAAVVDKAVAVDPEDRYAEVAGLAADLERVLRRESPEARPASVLRRARLLAERHPRPIRAACVGLFALSFAWGATQWASARARAAGQLWSDRSTRLALVTQEKIELAEELDFLVDEVTALEDRELLDRLLQRWRELGPRVPESLDARRRFCADAVQALDEDRHRAFLDRLRQGQGQRGTVERWLERSVGEILSRSAELRRAIAAVRKQIGEVEQIAQRSLVDAQELWEEAALDVELNPEYDGLVLRPQYGLLPLGENPNSGLYEFWDLRSGVEPEWDEELERFAVRGLAGMVFVLIPGGSFLMGEMRDQPFEPLASMRFPPHLFAPAPAECSVQLDPFFLSKYELTVSQAGFLWGIGAPVDPGDFEHPGESPYTAHGVLDMEALLQSFGLELPWEAQWEYAARAGGWFEVLEEDSDRSIAGHANVRDLASRRQGLFANNDIDEWLDDGAVEKNLVGSYLPNPFGLYDMQGNVAEWCADAWSAGEEAPVPGSGARTRAGTDDRALRGIHYALCARYAWSSTRGRCPPRFIDGTLGVRPMRELQR